jgi:AcrR family transcriptional regulator
MINNHFNNFNQKIIDCSLKQGYTSIILIERTNKMIWSEKTMKRTEQTDGRKVAIMEAAYSLFGTVGYARTSMKDIAAKAGVAQGLIGYYFGTKENLLVQVVREWMINRGMTESSAQLKGMTENKDIISNAIQHVVTFRRNNPEWFTLLISLWMEGRKNPDLEKEFEAIYSEMKLGVLQVINGLETTLEQEEKESLASIVQAVIDGLTLQALSKEQDMLRFQDNCINGMEWLFKGSQKKL